MREITGGELFAGALQAEGIEFLLGLPSPEIDPLLARLETHGTQIVPVRHEAAGVNMAEGLVHTADGLVHTADGGNTSWAYNVLPPTRPQSYHTILGLGMLGTGIPLAIGAKLGAPEGAVVCVTGDGAAGFNVMELQTRAREGIDITVAVFAKGSWTMEELNERQLYGTTFGIAQGEIRWDRVAQGLGCQGEYLERIEDLEGALRRSREHPAWSACAPTTTRTCRCPPKWSRGSSKVYSGPAKPATV